MSLNWSTEKVQYFKDNPDDLWVKFREGTAEEYEDVNVETKSLIFGSMAVSVGSITYKNAPLFYARWKFFEKYDNFYLYSTFDGKTSEKVYITPEVLIKHMGLSMNVSDQSDREWAKRIAKSYAQDHKAGRREELITEGMIMKFLKQSQEEFENSFYRKVTGE